MILLALLLALTQDVFVPPVPRGIGRDGKIRTAKQPIPFPRENQKWIRVRAPHFDVVSSVGETRTRDIARDLESLAAALTESTPRFEKARVPTTVFVFANRNESQPYFELLTGIEGTNVAGLYIRHGGGGAMFIDASRRKFERTAMHELVHDLLRQGDIIPPLWLEEGLAEYIANAQILRKGVVAGLPITPHVNLLASTPTRTVEQMFATTIETPQATSSYFYAQSWAAVHWLMRIDAKAFWPFLRDVEQQMPVADALRKHYNRSLDDLHGGIFGHAHRSAPVTLAAIAPVVTGELTVVDRPTLLFELGSFLGHVAGAEPEADRHFREAIRIDPKHAPSLAALGDFETALAADPNDAGIHLKYAETLLGPAVGDFAGVFEPADPARFRKARELANRALTRGALGISFLGDKDFESGIAALEIAHALAPWRMDYAIHLYSMYLRNEQRPKADALFAKSLENARDKQVIFAARNVLLEAETERANRLTREGKLEEAAALVRSMAATIPDPAGRADLERQAAQIDAVLLVNQHIRMYNDAVSYANTGRVKQAIKILDALLAVATDPVVVRDAERLRRELRKRKG